MKDVFFSATSPLKTYDIKQPPCDLHLARFSSISSYFYLLVNIISENMLILYQVMI